MATPDDRAEVLKDIENKLQFLASVEAPDLARTDDLGKSINFEEVVPSFQRLLDMAAQLP